MKRAVALGAATIIVIAAAVLWQQLPGIGAGALLYPSRHAAAGGPPAGCADTAFAGAGVTLRGWTCTPPGAVRGTIVYLHGNANHHGSATGVIQRFLPRGFRVVAYDSRAQGVSGGEVCTYGFYEKADLRRVIDTLPAGPFMIATSRDESRVYAVSLPDPVTFVSSVLSTIDASTLRVRAQIGVDVGIFPFISLGKVTTSVDDRLLFVTGLSLTAEKENRAATRMSVYDAETLDEMPWSPVQFGELLSFDLDMAPDGSRVFVLAGKDLGKSNASLYLCAVDPEFT